MPHATQYLNRQAARREYRRFRQVWSRPASLALVQVRLAVEPSTRLAAALTLARFGIPRTGETPLPDGCTPFRRIR